MDNSNETTPKKFGVLGSKGMIHRVLLVLAAAILAVSALYAANEPAQAQGKEATQGYAGGALHPSGDSLNH